MCTLLQQIGENSFLKHKVKMPELIGPSVGESFNPNWKHPYTKFLQAFVSGSPHLIRQTQGLS